MPKKPPLYPHIPKGQKKKRDDVAVSGWQERDRMAIWILDKRTEETIVEWWDDDARQMFEDGFFKPFDSLPSGGMGGRKFIESVLDYAQERGFIAGEEENSPPASGERKYTPEDLDAIAKIFYHVQASRIGNVYAFTPVYINWKDLEQSQRDQSIEGLKTRIEQETLTGYLERKRPQVGDDITVAIITSLKRGGYL